MPTSKIVNRKLQEPAPTTSRKGGGNNNKLADKASSFHGRIPTAALPTYKKDLRRPKTLPNLPTSTTGADSRPKLSKLLLNVTIQGSVGAVQVVMSPENTVGGLINAALVQYSKEGRRPVLPTSEASRFDLHYSQFSLESLHRDEKLIELGSRNFFLCPKKAVGDGTPSCSKQVDNISNTAITGIPWLKFIHFLC